LLNLSEKDRSKLNPINGRNSPHRRPQGDAISPGKSKKKRSRLISKLILDQDEFCLRVSMKIKAIRLTIKRSFSDLLDELREPEAKEDIDFILGSMRQRRFEISSYHYHKAD
jgi:hypothetical protein